MPLPSVFGHSRANIEGDLKGGVLVYEKDDTTLAAAVNDSPIERGLVERGNFFLFEQGSQIGGAVFALEFFIPKLVGGVAITCLDCSDGLIGYGAGRVHSMFYGEFIQQHYREGDNDNYQDSEYNNVADFDAALGLRCL
jgi:hypothetical protein